MPYFDDMFGALGELMLKGLKVMLVLLTALLIALLFFRPADTAIVFDSMKNSIFNAGSQLGAYLGIPLRISPEIFAITVITFAVIFYGFYKLANCGPGRTA